MRFLKNLLGSDEVEAPLDETTDQEDLDEPEPDREVPDEPLNADDWEPAEFDAETRQDLLADREQYDPGHDGYYYRHPSANEFDIALAYTTAANEHNDSKQVRHVFAQGPTGDWKFQQHIRSGPDADWHHHGWDTLSEPPAVAVAAAGRDEIAYASGVVCPACDEYSEFVSWYTDPVALDQDISVPQEYCPHCGTEVDEHGGWILQTEHQIERVTPTQERDCDG